MNYLLLLVYVTIGYSVMAGETLDLSRVSQLALQESPKIKQVVLQKEMQLQEVNQVGELPDPMMTYSWFGESVQTKVGPQEQKFGIQQSIPWPGKLIDQKNVIRKKAAITESMLLGTKARLILSIRHAWSDIQVLSLNKGVVEQTIKLYQNWKKKLMIDYQTGKSSYANVLKMKNEIEVLKDESSNLSRKLADRYFDLSEATNQKEINFSIDSNTFLNISTQLGTQVFPAEIISNPLLQAAMAKKSFWAAQESLSRNGYLPNLTIGLDYIKTGEAPGVAKSGNDSWLINVGMTLPLSFTKTSASIKETLIGQKQADVLTQEQSLMVSKITKKSFNQIEESMRRINLYRNTILPNIEQSIAVSEQSYVSGRQGFMQLIDDYRMRLNLQRKIYVVAGNEFKAKSTLLWILGDESSQFEFPYAVNSFSSQLDKGE